MKNELRVKIEAAIDGLITLLDEIDGDENLEPWMSGFDSRNMDDLESDLENEGDHREDLEPEGGDHAFPDTLDQRYNFDWGTGWSVEKTGT